MAKVSFFVRSRYYICPMGDYSGIENTWQLPFKDQAFLREFQSQARERKYHAGDVIIAPGELVVFIPIILNGSIRVIRHDASDNEIFLYYIYPGQTCAMSLNCCQAGARSMIKAIAETETILLQVPASLIDQWFAYPEWRLYISGNYSARFAELLEVIDLIAFNHMDKQLMHYIEERCRANGSRFLKATHQEIADELHTHREAITRLLKTMENKGLIRLGRNKIEKL